MSKGSKSRVSDLNRYRENYDRIFRKTKLQKEIDNLEFSLHPPKGPTISETISEILENQRSKPSKLFPEITAFQVYGIQKINLTDEEAVKELRRKQQHKIEINPQGIEEDERTEYDDECGV